MTKYLRIMVKLMTVLLELILIDLFGETDGMSRRKRIAFGEFKNARIFKAGPSKLLKG